MTTRRVETAWILYDCDDNPIGRIECKTEVRNNVDVANIKFLSSVERPVIESVWDTEVFK